VDVLRLRAGWILSNFFLLRRLSSAASQGVHDSKFFFTVPSLIYGSDSPPLIFTVWPPLCAHGSAPAHRGRGQPPSPRATAGSPLWAWVGRRSAPGGCCASASGPDGCGLRCLRCCPLCSTRFFASPRWSKNIPLSIYIGPIAVSSISLFWSVLGVHGFFPFVQEKPGAFL
jgi:hypothetical protein